MTSGLKVKACSFFYTFEHLPLNKIFNFGKIDLKFKEGYLVKKHRLKMGNSCTLCNKRKNAAAVQAVLIDDNKK